MSRRPLLLAVGLVLLIAVSSGWSWRVWQRQRRIEAVFAALPPIPNVERWPAGLDQELSAATQAVMAARDPLPSLALLAAWYHANGFLTEATRVLDGLRGLDPGNAHWPYLLADVCLRRGDTGGAESHLQSALALDPGYAPGWIRLGDVELERGNVDEAHQSFIRATRAAPDSVRAQYALIALEARDGRKGDPRPRLAALVKAYPEIKETHALSSRVHAAAGDLIQATREKRLAARSNRHFGTRDPWLDALAMRCFDAQWLGVTARRLAGERRLAEAESLLKRAASLAPKDAALRRVWGEVLLELQQAAAARGVLEQAVADCPNAVELPIALAHALCVEHKGDAAVAVVSRALQRWPHDGALHAALGLARREAGEYAQAVPALEAAIRLDPSLVEAHYALGFCLLATGHRETARAAIEQALAVRPEYPEALVLLGRLALDAGEIPLAERIVTELYRLQPDEPGSRLLFAGLQLVKGQAAEKAADIEAAVVCYRAGLAASPDLTPLLRAAGQLAVRRAEFEEAARWFERCVSLEPRELGGYLLLGEALEQSGRSEQAEDVFERGLAAARKAGNQSRIVEFSTRLER